MIPKMIQMSLFSIRVHSKLPFIKSTHLSRVIIQQSVAPSNATHWARWKQRKTARITRPNCNLTRRTHFSSNELNELVTVSLLGV